ncbi:MAG: hypothetical protein NVS3B26_06780 [Mycobacteriales bacterium]
MSEGNRPGLRTGLLAAGLVALVVLVIPIGALVRGKWSPLISFDDRVERAVHRDAVAHGILRDLAKVLTQLGAPVLVDLVSVALVAVLVLRGRRRSGLYLAACVAGAYLLSAAGKSLVGRSRPVFSDAFAHARGASFPSGHATGSAAFYLALAVVALSVLRRPPRGALLAAAIIVPVVVAATRVVLGVHYVSDVAAGLLIGWGWTSACTALFTAWRAQEGRPVDPTQEGIEPQPAPS